jgi:hypothetical protein
MQNIALSLSIVFWLLLSSPYAESWQSAHERRVTRYVNCDFGYIVRVPPGLIARVPEYARHGFNIDLPDGRSSIEVYNTYNMSGSSSPLAILKYQLQFQAELHPGWKVVSRHDQQVKGLAGTSVAAIYRYQGTAWKSHYIIAYRPLDGEGEGNIVYLFELSAPLNRYDKTLGDFNRVVDGFELTQIPRGPCSNDE